MIIPFVGDSESTYEGERITALFLIEIPDESFATLRNMSELAKALPEFEGRPSAATGFPHWNILGFSVEECPVDLLNVLTYLNGCGVIGYEVVDDFDAEEYLDSQYSCTLKPLVGADLATIVNSLSLMDSPGRWWQDRVAKCHIYPDGAVELWWPYGESYNSVWMDLNDLTKKGGAA